MVFQRIFYKILWGDIGDDLWQFVRNAFLHGTFDVRAAETFMVLVPMVDHPSNFKEFRPITLCNVVHKIILKVVVYDLSWIPLSALIKVVLSLVIVLGIMQSSCTRLSIILVRRKRKGET